MFLLRKVLSLAVLACALQLIVSSRASAQVADCFTFVAADWHLAGVSEYRSDWNDAIQAYQRVINESQPLPLDIREWYRGTAYFGICRSKARLHDNDGARLALTQALERHFWNFDLACTDTFLTNTCGRLWVDSLCRYWNGVLADERPTWGSQPTIMYYPSDYDSTDHWPLIIAMHGGNACYEEFARRWQNMADETHAVIAVPAGILRESQITNSWGMNVSAVEPAIDDIVDNLSGRHLIDRSQVYLSGFSQGAQAAIELTLMHPDEYRGAIAMSGFASDTLTDSALAQAQRQHVRIYAISGEMEDQIFAVQINAVHELCTQKHIPFRLEIVPGMIHEVPLDLQAQFMKGWNWLRPATEVSRGLSEH